MLIKLEHKERSYQQQKLPAGENRTNPGAPGRGFCDLDKNIDKG